MSEKLIVKLDNTSLGFGCLRYFDLMSIQGYRTLTSASAVYGIALHKYMDIMFKSKGDIRVAELAARNSFHMVKESAPDKQKYLGDYKHLLTVCYNLWDKVKDIDNLYDLLEIPVRCYECGGGGYINNQPCITCKGKMIIPGPASEVSFKILFYEDDYIKVFLCGTIDGIGLFKNGCFAIRDWKTTSAFQKDKYLDNYAMSRQLRMYVLALKLFSGLEPNSILGKVGASTVGVFIDGVFLKPKPNDVEFQRSEVYRFSNDDINLYRNMLTDMCIEISFYIKTNTSFPKTGILNNVCSLYNGCQYFNVCKNNDTVAKLLLERDFIKKEYNPLTFNE